MAAPCFGLVALIYRWASVNWQHSPGEGCVVSLYVIHFRRLRITWSRASAFDERAHGVSFDVM